MPKCPAEPVRAWSLSVDWHQRAAKTGGMDQTEDTSKRTSHSSQRQTYDVMAKRLMENADVSEAAFVSLALEHFRREAEVMAWIADVLAAELSPQCEQAEALRGVLSRAYETLKGAVASQDWKVAAQAGLTCAGCHLALARRDHG